MAILVLWLCLVIQPSSSRRSRHFCEHGYLWTAAGGRVAFALLSCSCDTWPAFYVYGGCGGPFAAGGPTPVFMTLPCAYHFLATSRFVSAWPSVHTPHTFLSYHGFAGAAWSMSTSSFFLSMDFCGFQRVFGSSQLGTPAWQRVFMAALPAVPSAPASCGYWCSGSFPSSYFSLDISNNSLFLCIFRDFNSPRCYFLGVCIGTPPIPLSGGLRGRCSKRCTGHMQLASAVGR